MMGCDVPHHRTAPVVADPDRLVPPERRQQFQHVLDDQLLGKILMALIGTGATIAAHVGRDAAEAQRGHCRQLMPPGERQLGPAVAEDQERRAFRSASEIARGVTGGLDGVFGDRECHEEEKVPWKSTPAQPNFYAPCATAWR